MSNIQYAQWTSSGTQEYETGAEAVCEGKVFYVSGLTVTRRKTSIRAQGGAVMRGKAAPCTASLSLAMNVIFKGDNSLWPTLFNKRFSIPVSLVSNNNYGNNQFSNLYSFYIPTVSVSYFSPDRKFYFSLSNIGVCIPKEFFDIGILLPAPTETEPNPTQKTYWDVPHVTSENLQYLEGTKKTPTTFYFKSFEWSSGYSYCYSSLSRTLANYFQDPFYYPGKEKTTEMQENFDDKCLGVFPSFTFLASDYCYEVENGNLYFKSMTLVPSDPELSDIIGIESISCKLSNAL